MSKIPQKLWFYVLSALVLGVAAGVLFGPDVGWVTPDQAAAITGWLALPGYVFLGLLKMIVVPLVLVAVICGIVAAGDVATVRTTGLKVVLYFVCTTAIAVTIGVALANLIEPGLYVPASYVDAAMAENAPYQQAAYGLGLAGNDLPQQLAGLIPTNPFSALAAGRMLQVVIFAVIVGAALVSMPKKQAEPLHKVLESAQALFMVIVRWVLRLTPIAVFGLMAKVVSTMGLVAVTAMLAYVGTVLAGLLAMLLVYLFILFFTAGIPPLHFLKLAKEAQILAFSTSSSSATMPVTLRVAEEGMQLKPSIARFVIPLGTTVNMDGTALYQAIATVFLAQVFAIDLGLGEFLTVLVLAIAASIGTPGMPGAGIVILASILLTIGVPPQGIALIIGVDRLLDMCRTSINVTGDLVAANVMNARAR